MEDHELKEKNSSANGSTSGNLSSIQLGLISTAQLHTINLYVFSIAIPVCIFGLASNIANIVVFYKMGLSSVSNICFFCLAITDFNCVTYILVVAFAFHLGMEPHAFLPMSMIDVVMISDTAYYGFSAMGSWITAIINMERSCCVVSPLKVRLSFCFNNPIKATFLKLFTNNYRLLSSPVSCVKNSLLPCNDLKLGRFGF